MGVYIILLRKPEADDRISKESISYAFKMRKVLKPYLYQPTQNVSKRNNEHLMMKTKTSKPQSLKTYNM